MFVCENVVVIRMIDTLRRYKADSRGSSVSDVENSTGKLIMLVLSLGDGVFPPFRIVRSIFLHYDFCVNSIQGVHLKPSAVVIQVCLE